jgi:transcriptional regulator with XRE-family HTH domain
MSTPKPPNRLRTLRKEAGLTQDEVAYAIGVTRSTLAYYESNKRLPTLDILQRLEELFDVPLSKIYPGTGLAAAQYVRRHMKAMLSRLLAQTQDVLSLRKIRWFTQRLPSTLAL